MNAVACLDASTVLPGQEDVESQLGSRILEAWKCSLVVAVQGVRAGPEVFQFWDRMAQRIGTPVDLAEDATAGDRDHQRTGQRWMEIRFDPTIPNAYRHSANAQPLHTDGSYIPSFPSASLMFCISSASVGGETIFLPGDVLVDILQSEAPALLERLWEVPVKHCRSGDERTESILRRNAAGEVLVNWNYYCVDRSVTSESVALAEDFFTFLRDEPKVKAACVPVLLGAGDAVLWKDDHVLHGRNAFQASSASERWIWKCAVDVGVAAWP